MNIKDKVTVVGNNYGHLFTHAKKENLRHGGETIAPFKVKIEVLPNGTKVFIPKGTI